MVHRQHTSPSRAFVGGVFLFLFFWIASATFAHGQALPGASKSTDISVFGGFLFQNPAYYQPKNTGAMVGADLTQYVGWRIAPSLEIRGNRGTGAAVTERSVVGGLKLQTDVRQFHPYVDFLVGGGTIIFLFPGAGYHEDRSTVYSPGGGIDFDLPHHFQAKADFQFQHWDLGIQHPMPFTPTLFTIGVAYKIPFRVYRKHSD